MIHIDCMLLLLHICTIDVHYLSYPKDDHQKACWIGKGYDFLSSSLNNAPQKVDVVQSGTLSYSHLSVYQTTTVLKLGTVPLFINSITIKKALKI